MRLFRVIIQVQFTPSICDADVNDDGSLAPADFTASIASFNAPRGNCDNGKYGEKTTQAECRAMHVIARHGVPFRSTFKKTKPAAVATGLLQIAGAGFEPTTSGL